jgi:hypothetical protein
MVNRANEVAAAVVAATKTTRTRVLAATIAVAAACLQCSASMATKGFTIINGKHIQKNEPGRQ